MSEFQEDIDHRYAESKRKSQARHREQAPSFPWGLVLILSGVFLASATITLLLTEAVI